MLDYSILEREDSLIKRIMMDNDANLTVKQDVLLYLL